MTIPAFEDVWDEYVELKGNVDEDVAFLVTEIYRTEPGAPDYDAKYDEAWEENKDHYHGVYASIIDAIEDAAGDSIWRAMKLDPDMDATRIDPIGTYWAFYEHDAIAYETSHEYRVGPDAVEVRYRARLDLDDVNWFEALLNGMVMNESESEVTIHEGARIFVYDVEQSDGTVLPINAWRRA